MAGAHIALEWVRQVNVGAAWYVTWKGELT